MDPQSFFKYVSDAIKSIPEKHRSPMVLLVFLALIVGAITGYIIIQYTLIGAKNENIAMLTHQLSLMKEQISLLEKRNAEKDTYIEKLKSEIEKLEKEMGSPIKPRIAPLGTPPPSPTHPPSSVASLEKYYLDWNGAIPKLIPKEKVKKPPDPVKQKPVLITRKKDRATFYHEDGIYRLKNKRGDILAAIYSDWLPEIDTKEASKEGYYTILAVLAAPEFEQNGSVILRPYRWEGKRKWYLGGNDCKRRIPLITGAGPIKYKDELNVNCK